MDSRVSGGTGPLAGTKLIAGSGRSGTTWVQDALADANRLRPVFEPLHPRVSPVGARYAHRAIGAEESHPELEQFLDEACAGTRERFWTQYRCQRGFLLPTRDDLRTYAGAAGLAHRWRKFVAEVPGLARVSVRREPLVKCIWANLMLGWLSRRCGFRVVLIVRHPGAVVESEHRNVWSARSTLDRMRRDRRLHELTDGRYLRLLGGTLTPIEEFAALWVIENQWNLETASRNGVTVVFYERLKAMHEPEWQKLRIALDLPRLPDASRLARPSQQTAPQNSDTASATAERPRWLLALSGDEKGRVQGVLDQVNFRQYSMSDPSPCVAEVGAGYLAPQAASS